MVFSPSIKLDDRTPNDAIHESKKYIPYCPKEGFRRRHSSQSVLKKQYNINLSSFFLPLNSF
jgi:hypothetical protein